MTTRDTLVDEGIVSRYHDAQFAATAQPVERATAQVKGFVEAQFGARGRQLFLRCPLTHIQVGRIAGQVKRGKGKQGDADNHNDGLEQPLNEVGGHVGEGTV